MELDEVDRITVLGAGSMGHGIAEVAALAGYEVTMRDIGEELVQNGYDQIEWSLGKLADSDQITAEERDAALERVTPVVDVGEAVADADVVVEAVPEKMEIKKEVYRDVEAAAPDRALFASNTSSLSITELSEVTDRPEQFCGMHFFNPPVRMQLVEVISGAHTDESTLDTIEGLAEAFEKTPVRVRKDSPGFIVNRVAVPLMNEVAWMVHDEEATVAEVDSTTKYDMGMPMGAFELADYVGIDVNYDVLTYLEDVLGEAYEPCPLIAEKVEAEALGKKTGEGFYDYENGGVDIPAEEGRKDVARRLTATMANEVAKLVGGDVADPAEIDEAVMLGLGFPEGPAKTADAHGLADLVDALDEAHEVSGHPRHEVSDALREAAAEGGFYGSDSDESGPEFDVVRVEYPGDMVGRIVLDRPHRMNTISDEVLDELETAIDVLEADEAVRSVLLVGEGDRAFSAGADVTSMAAGGADQLGAVELSRRGQRVFGRLKNSDMPVVAGIDGYALGGGMELATCADLRVASERSELGQPEHDLGLLPGWGGTQRLQRIVGEGRAKEIIFTAERYDAAEMADYGFVNEVVPNDELEDRAHELAADLAAGPPVAQRLTKRAMHVGWENEDAGLEVEAEGFGLLFGTDDLMEGITAFTGDREPEFEGK
jgi:enoyl-CoA hydratase/3-hydroxyacyl-CoA dehydrogenase